MKPSRTLDSESTLWEIFGDAEFDPTRGEPARLVQDAREARSRAYAPYSGFHVGAAALMEGEVHVGANVENASYGGTICAERTAIAHAVAFGARSLESIAISTDAADAPDTSSRAPCGLCRQVMAEFAGPETLVFLDAGRTEDGRDRIEVLSFEDLFPLRFRLEPGEAG